MLRGFFLTRLKHYAFGCSLFWSAVLRFKASISIFDLRRLVCYGAFQRTEKYLQKLQLRLDSFCILLGSDLMLFHLPSKFFALRKCHAERRKLLYN